ADIDALPIKEINGTDFDSIYENVMHACGHDFHTANLLSVLTILNQHRHEFAGTVLGIFQPAEEKIPGGAKTILESRKLKPYAVKAVLGLHVSPKHSVGYVEDKRVKFEYSEDEIYRHINSRYGYAS